MLVQMARSLSTFMRVMLTFGLGTSALRRASIFQSGGHHASHQSCRIKRFSAVCGADIPRWILRRLESLENDSDGLKAFGEEVVTSLCEQLIRGGVPGLHFYT